MGHPLLTVYEVTRTIDRTDHQCGPEAVGIKYKPYNTGPIVAHLPQYGYAFLLVERIACVNREKPPVLLLDMLLLQEPHRVNPPFDPCLQSTAELLRTAGILGTRPRHLQQ